MTLFLMSNPLWGWGILAHVADEPNFELLYLSFCLGGGSSLLLVCRYWSLHLEVLIDHQRAARGSEQGSLQSSSVAPKKWVGVS